MAAYCTSQKTRKNAIRGRVRSLLLVQQLRPSPFFAVPLSLIFAGRCSRNQFVSTKFWNSLKVLDFSYILIIELSLQNSLQILATKQNVN
jgi:hypothetical protein